MRNRSSLYHKILFSFVFMAVFSAFALGGSGLAQKFPSKPITVVIHAKYGGGTDTTARRAGTD